MRHSNIRIRHFDVDLSVERGRLDAVMDELTDRLIDWALSPSEGSDLLAAEI